MIPFSFVHIGWTLKWKLFLGKIVRFFYWKLDILLQWEPENYGTERQHHSVFDVVTSQTKLITNLLKGVFAKNERGYRLNAIKKALLITSNLTSICCVYKEKTVKNDSCWRM